MSEWTINEVRRYWASKDSDDEMICFEGMQGRMPLSDLIEHLAEVAPGLPFDQIGINYATVMWTDRATDEERATRAEHKARAAERHAKWERETYERLKGKFGAAVEGGTP